MSTPSSSRARISPTDVAAPPSVARRAAFIASQCRETLGADAAPIDDVQTFDWTVERWATRPARSSSPTFDCGGRRWRISCHADGPQQGATPRGPLSLFLDHVGGDEGDWSVEAAFACVVVFLTS